MNTVLFYNRNAPVVLFFGMLLFTCLSLTPATATEIVIVRTPKKVTVAADSRRVARSGSATSQEFKVCKIKRTRDVFVVASGMAYLIEGTGLEILTRDVDLAHRIQELEESLRIVATPAVARVRETLPSKYGEFLHGLPIIQVVIFGIDHGESFFYVREFGCELGRFVANRCKVVVTVRDKCPGHACDGNDSMAIDMPYRPSVASFLDKHPRFFSDTPTPQAVRQIIQIAHDAYPEQVDDNINIFELTPTRQRWIADEAGCQNEWENSLRK